jgi:hypothetical protein
MNWGIGMAQDTRGGSLASHRRGGRSSRPRKPPSQQSTGQRHIAPAEAAQARLFEGMLRKEIAEMRRLPPHAAAEMHARIAEADRLIKALRDRFPYGPTPASPLVRELHTTAQRNPRALTN